MKPDSFYDSSTEDVKVGRIILYIFGIVVVIGVLGYVLGIFGEAAQVAKEELGPRAARDKYSWFLQQASAIEKMDQDIKLFEARAEDVDKKYSYDGDISKMPIDVRTLYIKEKQQVRDDLIAVVSQRNNLVKEYNAASENFLWAPFETELDKPRKSFQEYQVK